METAHEKPSDRDDVWCAPQEIKKRLTAEDAEPRRRARRQKTAASRGQRVSLMLCSAISRRYSEAGTAGTYRTTLGLDGRRPSPHEQKLRQLWKRCATHLLRNTSYIFSRCRKGKDRCALSFLPSAPPAGLACRRIRPCAPGPVPAFSCAGRLLRFRQRRS